jgi:hypothetical protein
LLAGRLPLARGCRRICYLQPEEQEESVGGKAAVVVATLREPRCAYFWAQCFRRLIG